MVNTPNLDITEMEQSQSQKHVTFNEAVNRIDSLIFLAVADRDLTTPPGSPTEGDRYIVASGGSGAWSGADNDVAIYQSGAWVILTPQEGWKAHVNDENLSIKFNGTTWVLDGGSGIILSDQVTVAESANEGQTGINAVEEEITGLAGATATSTISFPSQSIILGVSVRVTTTITGAASFDCGDGASADRFGGSLGIALGSTNQGLIGPTGNYASTTVTLTANGSNFTAGAVRICLHYISTQPPQS